MVRSLLFFVLGFAPVLAAAKDSQFETDVKSAGAILEKGTGQVTINPDGTLKSKYSIEFKIQTEAGRTEFGLRDITYSPDISEISDIVAFSQTGTELARTNKKDITERAESTAKFGINNYKKLIIPFSNIKVGSTIVYRYTETLKKPLLPNLSFFSVKFGDETPEQVSILEVTSPKPLRTTVLDNDKLLEVVEGKANDKYTLTIKNKSTIYKIPELKTLSLVPSGVLPMVIVSTATSWNEVAKPMTEKYEKAIESPLPEAFQKIVKEGSTKTDEIEKLKFVTSAVSKLIAYSGNWTTQAGMFFPRGHQQVVSEAKGDCKDFATSVAAILRKMGFDASVALVNSSNPAIRIFKDVDVKTLVPSTDYFNHAIVFVKRKSGANIWLDATSPVDYVEGIWPSLADSPALILKADTNELAKVPESSSKVSSLTLTRTVKVESPTQASWQGEFKANGYFAIDLAQQRALHGPEKIDAALPNYFLKQSASKESQIKMTNEALKQGGSEILVSFNTLGKNPTSEGKDKDTAVTMDFDDTVVGFFNAGAKKGMYIGPVSDSTTVTKYEGVFAHDPVSSDCFVLSDWVDYERVVIPVNSGTTVKTIVKLKKSYVTAADIKKDEFGHLLQDLKECLVEQTMEGHLGSLKPAVADAKKAVKGKVDFHTLPIESASAAAAERAIRMGGGLDFTYVSYKTKRIFEKQLEENPKNLRARLFRARAVMRLGYLVDKNFKKNFVDYAMNEIEEVIKANPKDDLAHFYKARILTDQLGKHDLAMASAITAYKLDANASLNRSMFAKIYLNKKDYNLADSWLQAAKSSAKTDIETSLYLDLLEDLAKSKGDNKMRIKVLTEIANLEPESPWVWHNLAIAYFSEDLDKTIELEKKALAISEFGAAKKTLSEAFNNKAVELMKGRTIIEYSKDRKVEETLLEAQKYDPSNVVPVKNLARNYFARSESENETDWLDKSDIYIAEGLKIDPKDQELLKLESATVEIKKKLMVYFKQRGIKPTGRWPATMQ